jgi:outer membrane immunogenic protein
MKKFLLAGVATVALIGTASAADLGRGPYKAPPMVAPPPPPAFTWTGCFVGAHWGWGWGRKDVHEHFEAIDTEDDDFSVGPFAASGDINTSGPLFGGQVGCDYQFGYGKGTGGPGGFVIGIQGDAAAADINGFNDDPLAVALGNTGFGLHLKDDFIASVTGRIGWAYLQTLWYFKGGVAWTHDRWDLHATDFFLGNDFTSQTRTGWTIGVGAEWAFLPNWSAFVEWDHYDFGTKGFARNGSASCGEPDELDELCAISASLDSKQRIETVKIGVNYRFNLFGIGKGVGVQARY